MSDVSLLLVGKILTTTELVRKMSMEEYLTVKSYIAMEIDVSHYTLKLSNMN